MSGQQKFPFSEGVDGEPQRRDRRGSRAASKDKPFHIPRLVNSAPLYLKGELGSVLPQNFNFKKSLGQNFISDTNLLKAIVSDAGVDENSCVLEIGAGAGTLTAELGKVAKQVVAVEVDNALIPLLNSKFAGSNVTVVHADILKLSAETIKSWFNGAFKVVANLPYYITSPILFKLIEDNLNIESITVMVQKEVAERVTAKPGTKNYGGITVQLDYRGKTQYLRTVPRTVFKPPPNVDSAVIKFTPEPNKYNVLDIDIMDKTIKAAFAMRRKTLVNNLCAAFGFDRSKAEELLVACGLNIQVRGEVLTTTQFVELANKIPP
ncbi:MAG: 16S rRNA (adenine(1518)-N(6)/adenine(1519)-N(6))-dimethyltransferase RsmA [Firmicutes bacterium]|nr:16S rRNA (adenine(1518)-N(6)/adenine(1519)-N(6))-dimethyltransferase RsmA [Bacillota bacterium]